MNWKYTDSTNTVVFRVTDLGSESCFISEISDWIAAGNIPDAADPPAINTPTVIIPATPLEARRVLLGDSAIGLTDAQVDAIFHLAQTIGN